MVILGSFLKCLNDIYPQMFHIENLFRFNSYFIVCDNGDFVVIFEIIE